MKRDHDSLVGGLALVAHAALRRERLCSKRAVLCSKAFALGRLGVHQRQAPAIGSLAVSYGCRPVKVRGHFNVPY